MESLAAEEFDALVSAAQRGEEWAFTTLYRTHNGRLARFAQASMPTEADDLVAQTWLDATRNIERFTGDEDAFRGWLFTILRRRTVDARRRARRRVASDAPLAGDLEPAVDSAETDALRELDGERAARRIAEVLPADLAEIVLLRVVAGLSAEEVATIVGRKPGTVRVLQHRALRRLAERLKDSHEL